MDKMLAIKFLGKITYPDHHILSIKIDAIFHNRILASNNFFFFFKAIIFFKVII